MPREIPRIFVTQDMRLRVLKPGSGFVPVGKERLLKETGTNRIIKLCYITRSSLFSLSRNWLSRDFKSICNCTFFLFVLKRDRRGKKIWKIRSLSLVGEKIVRLRKIKRLTRDMIWGAA